MKPYLIYFFLLLLGFCLCRSQPADAQRRKRVPADTPAVISVYDIDTLLRPVPRQRMFFRDRVDKEQKRADYFDGSRDQVIYYGDDTVATRLLTQALLADVDRIQVLIENLELPDAPAGNQERIRYHTAVYNLLRRFNADTRADPVNYRREVTNLRGMIIARDQDRLTSFIRDNINIQSLRNAELLDWSSEPRQLLYRELSRKEPALLIDRMSDYAQEPYACAVIAEAAKAVPGKVLTYALSTRASVSGPVKRCNDPLVQTIVKIAAKSASPRKALAFLGAIHSGDRSIAEADGIAADANLYLRELVRLKLSDEPLGREVYTDELQHRSIRYVRDINERHDRSDAIRFKDIEGFSPEELYFLVVYGVEEIYTSSYTGIFNRMMARLRGRSGEALLESVHRDHFRTFIRMCAYYGKLSDFLGSMNEAQKTALMKDFVDNLESGAEGDLTDAVDVADAFSCIEDEKLASFLHEEIRRNFTRCREANLTKGMLCYGLLNDVFRAFRGDSAVISGLNDLSVNTCPFSAMQADSSGIVYIQAFYYGDDDGRAVFNSSLNTFPVDQWKIERTNEYWTTISSTKGRPIVIFANNPVPEPGDEEAQRKLRAWLSEHNIHPTMIIHRGHSYFLPSTIEGMQQQNRIIMLGSCGGYHNLGKVLEYAPDAQIISTRQIGTYKVNRLIIDGIIRQLQEGKDIDWTQTWHAFEQAAARQGGDVLARFRDYVPPHKNLGAIFIKIYRRMATMQEGAREQ